MQFISSQVSIIIVLSCIFMTEGDPEIFAACSKVVKPQPGNVPPEFRSWDRSLDDYQPVLWAAPCPDSDCDEVPGESKRKPKYNSRDRGIDRRSAKACGVRRKYKVDKLPINPAGRTGLIGRGLLRRYGPNHLIKVMFVDDRVNPAQVFAKTYPNATPTIFFEEFTDDPQSAIFPGVLEKELVSTLLQTIRKFEVDFILLDAEERQMQKKEILSGNCPSDLETDNAWVECHVRVLLCSENENLCDIGLEGLRTNFGWTWIPTRNATVHGSRSSIMGALKQGDPLYYAVFCRVDRKWLQRNWRQRFAFLVTLSTASLAAVGIFGAASMVLPVALFGFIFMASTALLIGKLVRTADDYWDCHEMESVFKVWSG